MTSFIQIVALMFVSVGTVFAASIKFDIPAQAAPSALMAFSTQSGVEVFFAFDELKAARTAPVHGEFEPDAAIARLLQGTGFSAKRNARGKFVVTAIRQAAKSGGITGSLLAAPRNTPIADVRVRLAGTELSTTTDAQGRFTLTDIPPGRHLLNISSETIRPAKIAGVVVVGGQTTELDPFEIPIPNSDGSLDMKEYVVDASELGKGAVKLAAVEVSSTKDTGIVNQGVIPREENQAVRYNLITRDDIERTGMTSLADLMRLVSGNTQMGTTTQRGLGIAGAGSGFFFQNGDQVDLRGFGANQTLVMINGRRLYGSDTFVGPDVSRIPLTAIERVEILPSSGSAIYGANSVGGVVNIVLRKGYSGTEVTTYLGASASGGAEEMRFTLYHGRTFNKGRSNVTVALEYHRQYELTFGDRAYYYQAFGVPGLASPSLNYRNRIIPYFPGPRANIVTSSTLGLGIDSNPAAAFATIPPGSNGAGLTPASFNSTANTAALSTARYSREKLVPAFEGYSGVVNFDHAIFGERLGAYAELTWRNSLQSLTYPQGNYSVSLSATSPVNPFRTNVVPGFTGRAITVYRAPDDLPDNYQETKKVTQRVVAGVKGKLEFFNGRLFNWAIDGSWDRNEAENLDLIWIGGLSAAANAGVYNIFRDLTNATPLPLSEAMKFRYDYFIDRKPTIVAGNVRLNGEGLRLWGGPVQFSLGGETRREVAPIDTRFTNIGEYNFLPGGSGTFLAANTSFSRSTRDVQAAYGEIVLPVIGPQRPRFGLHSLDLSGGIRYEKYSDFSAARPPMAAVKIGLTRDFALRAAYGEGFQPPTISNLNSPVTTNTATATFADPLRPTALPTSGYVQIGGGNPNLQPETAETWDVGAILTPRWLPGLTLNISYFRYDKDNVVTSLNIVDTILYAPERIVRGPATADDIAAGRPGAVTRFDGRPINIARQFIDGWDYSLRYSLPPTGLGRFSLTSDGTWTKRFLRQARPQAPLVDSAGLLPFFSSFNSPPVEWRANAGVTWQNARWGATLRAAYISSFESNTTTPTAKNPTGLGIDGSSIDSTVTFDTQISYEFPYRAHDSNGAAWKQWLIGTKWSLGVQNVLDSEPAYWSEAARGFYTQGVDPRQRFIYMQIKKTL